MMTPTLRRFICKNISGYVFCFSDLQWMRNHKSNRYTRLRTAAFSQPEGGGGGTQIVYRAGCPNWWWWWLDNKIKTHINFSLHLQCAAQNGCNVRLTISHFNDIDTCARQRSVHVRMFTYKALAAASFRDDEPRDLGAVLFLPGPQVHSQRKLR